MASSPLSSPATNQPVADAETTLTQRRIRHITAIQIRNLTPFPVRDAFASALTQPAEQPQFSSHGHLSDDLDVTVSRKRSRKISTTSVAAHGSLWSDEGSVEDAFQSGGVGEMGRKSSASRVSFSSGAGSRGRPYSASGSTPTVRPYRHRTNSSASHLSAPSIPTSVPSGGLISSLTTIIPDNSQTGLEKVINARLVETFLVISIPQPSTPVGSPSSGPISRSPSSSTGSPRDRSSASKGVNGVDNHLARKTVKATPLSPSEKVVTHIRRELSASARLPPPSKTTNNHIKSASSSALRPNGKTSGALHSFPSPQKPSLPLGPRVPMYISPIRRPSTNPSFPIDTKSNHNFSEGIDLSGDKMKIEVWGKVGERWKRDVSFQRKGKEKELEPPEDADKEWKVLDEWLVDLTDLVPLSDGLAMHPSQLSSNTLQMTLSPPGGTFYLPSYHPARIPSPSPSVGYASDPELEVRKVKQSSATAIVEPPGQNDGTITRSQRRHGVGFRGYGSTEVSKTANWQDLFKLITLQSCILDNEVSLHEVVRGVDAVLESDITSNLRREVSEREARLEELIVNRRKVAEESDQLRYDIKSRRDTLRQRREMLALAREQHRKALEAEFETKDILLQDRAQHLSLRARFGPTRTTLLTILSAIFPIELLSPPDLLYTILDVPLPIPVTSSDPGPPLMVPTHKEVNEDTVATSLGYAAQVVQLLAAYLGKGLVYPVTCVGSRSLIRDGISAMVGPRMFPLFSKGVDTYRFEYGVFLLNKDIEMLMADRDLRALDMRHTLPNLKNLLLTLTDGEGVSLRPLLPPSSPMSLVSDLESISSHAESPAEHESNTPKVKNLKDLPAEGSTPPTSGATTPTAAATDASRKARPFLGFSPFTDILRGRYPSSIRISGKSPSSISENAQGVDGERTASVPSSGEQEGSDEEEDRKTIHGVILDADLEPRGQGKPLVHDHAAISLSENDVVLEDHEKLGSDNYSPSHTTLSVPFPHIK